MLQTSGESFKGVINESVSNLILLLQQGTHGVSLAFLFDPIVSVLSIQSLDPSGVPPFIWYKLFYRY